MVSHTPRHTPPHTPKHTPDAAIIEQTLRVAGESVAQGCGGPFGAAVFATGSGEILAVAANRVLADCDPTAHAEMGAIRKACAAVGNPHLEGYSLYATGQPCPMCLAAIHWARLDAYYYTTTYAEAAAIGFDDAAIRDSLAGVIAPMTPGTPWPDEAVRRFFLEYGGKRY